MVELQDEILTVMLMVKGTLYVSRHTDPAMLGEILDDVMNT